MTWLATKHFLQKAWVWTKNYWYLPLLLVLALAAFLVKRSDIATKLLETRTDSRLHDDAVKEVSGVITSISAPPDPTGPVTDSPEGPYVLVTHVGGTVEINPEWFDSVYMMGGE
jgi:hypothetical protein